MAFIDVSFHPAFALSNKFAAQVPLYCVTPGKGRCIHRFFDTSPFSPSGRFMAVFRMPFEDRPPRPGDRGEIVVIDLEEGEEKVVATTAGWESQMGANINWGLDDNTIIFNDVDQNTWTPVGVKLDWPSGKSEQFARGVYHVSPDGRYAVCANLATMCHTQYGYGVIVPEDKRAQFRGLRDDDGVWVTDLETLETRLLISIREAARRTFSPEELLELEKYENYIFHTKWNPQGTRLMFSLRRYPHTGEQCFDMLFSDGIKFDVFTISADGKEIYNAIDSEKWKNPGHHTNWFPEGDRLSMNLAVDGDGIVKICQVNYDGSDFKKMFDPPIGSGHPTVHESGKFLVTDAYSHEPVAFSDGAIPLRYIDLKTKEEAMLARLPIVPPGNVDKLHKELRLDPHPAWDRSWRYLAFNAIDGGTRRVYVADMKKFI